MKVLAWGSGSEGTLALGNEEDVISPSYNPHLTKLLSDNSYLGGIQVVGGANHILLLLNGMLWGWGVICNLNVNVRDHYSLLIFTPIASQKKWLIPKKIEISGQAIHLEKIEAGWSFSCCITRDKELYFWGTLDPCKLTFSLFLILPFGECHRLNGCESNALSVKADIPIPIEAEIKIDSVACGLRHALFISTEKSLYGWGDGSFGQLGNNSKSKLSNITNLEFVADSLPRKVCCGWRHSLVLTNNGQVYASGWNKYGQLGTSSCSNSLRFEKIHFDSDQRITNISCGWSHNIALTEGDDICTWGRGDFGQLGLGDKSHRNFPHKLERSTFGERINISTITTGSEHCAVLAGRSIYVWGWNDHGQLGLGDKEDRNKPTCIDTLANSVSALFTGPAYSFAVVD